jgi:PAS domain S-box-containing protein
LKFPIILPKSDEEAPLSRTGLLNLVFDTLPDLLVLKDRNFVYRTANPAFCRFLGKEEADILGKTDFDLFPEAEAKRYRHDDALVLATRRPQVQDEEVTGAAGKRWLQVIKTPVLDEQGLAVGLLCTVRDVSERKEIEEALRETTNTLQALIAAAPLAITSLDRDLRVQLWNPAAERIFGWSEAEVLGGPAPIIPEDQWPEALARIRRDLEGESQSALELRRLRRDGSMVDVSLWTAPRRNAKGEIIGDLGIFADISRRKEMEKALKASEANYRAIFNAMNDGIAVVDPETGNFLDVNQKWCEMSGFSPEEASELSVAALCLDMPGFTPADAMQLIKAASQGTPQFFEFHAKNKEGRRHWVEINLKLVIIGGQKRLLAVIRDISARKESEEALRASEAKYRNLVEQIPAITYVAALDDVSTAIFISPQIEAVLGFTPEEWLADPELYKKQLHPEDRDRVLTDLLLNYAEQGWFSAEYRMFSKSGRVVWIRDQSRAVYDSEGRPLFMQGVALDITERKRAQEAADEVRRQQEAILSNISDLVWLKDREGRLLVVNDQFGRACGLTPREAAGKFDQEIWGPKLGRKFRLDDLEVMATGRQKRLEEFLMDPDGRTCWVETIKTPIYNEHREVVGTAGIARDITKRRLMEAALRKVSRALKAVTECNQALLRAANEAELLSEVCRIIVEVGGYRMAWVGYAQGDEEKSVRPMAQKGFDEGYVQTLRITWDDKERGRGPVGKALRTGKPAITRDTQTDPGFAPWREEALKRGFASVLALPLGEAQPFGTLAIYAAEPNAFDEEEVELLVGLANDLTYGIKALRAGAERRRAEEALRQSESKYRTLMNSASDAIVLADPQGAITEVNRRAEDLLGYPEAELLGLNFSRIHPPQRRRQVLDNYREVLKTGSGRLHEGLVLHRDGRKVPVEITQIMVEYGGQRVVQTIFRDITERKQAEEALRDSEQKLRQLASQLLTIQEKERRRVSRELHDELGQALTVLKIHLVAIENKLRRDQAGLKANCEKLLSDIDAVIENVRRLSYDLSPSTLEDLGLSSSLKHLVEETCRNHQILCDLTLAEIDHLFSPETKINIYRIFQESLTNMVRHAAADHIAVEIAKQSDRVTFRLKDNGKGFDLKEARSRTLAKRGLGLTTMQERALLAGGRLSLRSRKGRGTAITLTIPIQTQG